MYTCNIETKKRDYSQKLLEKLLKIRDWQKIVLLISLHMTMVLTSVTPVE